MLLAVCVKLVVQLNTSQPAEVIPRSEAADSQSRINLIAGPRPALSVGPCLKKKIFVHFCISSLAQH